VISGDPLKAGVVAQQVLQQCDLLVGEWTNFLTIDG
jgi:hypothetical protein